MRAYRSSVGCTAFSESRQRFLIWCFFSVWSDLRSPLQNALCSIYAARIERSGMMHAAKKRHYPDLNEDAPGPIGQHRPIQGRRKDDDDLSRRHISPP